jgi:poly(3-hydroxybutyrate) depolymerase
MIWRLVSIVVICLAVQGASSAAGRRHETGFLDRAVTMGGVEYRYEIYVPRDYDSARSWPIILALHGGGDYGSDGIRPTVGALAKAIRLHPDRFPAIVVFPQAHADGTPGWQQKGGEAALVEVEKAVTEFHGDSSRIYLTGYSAGGNGAWFVAYHHPNRVCRAGCNLRVRVGLHRPAESRLLPGYHSRLDARSIRRPRPGVEVVADLDLSR